MLEVTGASWTTSAPRSTRSRRVARRRGRVRTQRAGPRRRTPRHCTPTGAAPGTEWPEDALSAGAWPRRCTTRCARPAVVVPGEDMRESWRGDEGPLDASGPTACSTRRSRSRRSPLRHGRGVAGALRWSSTRSEPALIAFEQIVNQAQKLPLIRGQANVPVTYIVPGSGTRLWLAGQTDHPYRSSCTWVPRRCPLHRDRRVRADRRRDQGR